MLEAAGNGMDGRRLLLNKAGAPSTMTVERFEPAAPGPGEVVVGVTFSGVNFADLLQRLGFYNPRPPYPFTPGYEASGHVLACGEGVEHLEVGQAVIAVPGSGAHTSHLLCDAGLVMPLPAGMTHQQGAALPVTYLTAHHMLHHLGGLKPGHTVLVHGGAGGVGTAALQLCRWMEAGPVWATASAPKRAIVESLGGTFVDRHAEDFVEVIKRGTNGRGVDHVLDPIGGTHLERSLACVAEGGRLYTYGLSQVAPSGRRRLLYALMTLRRRTKFDPLRLMNRNRAVHGVHMGTWSDRSALMPQIERLLHGVAEGHIDPVIDRIFPVEEAAEAHQHLHDGANVGKVLLSF